MIAFVRALGWVLMVFGALLCVMGIATLPDGGLMFALPYVFLIPGLTSLFFGYLLLQLKKRE